MDFKDLIAFIQKILDKFFGVLPQIQKEILESVLNKTQQLELSGNQIRISAENLKRLAEVQSSLRNILLSDNYMKAVGGYAKAYNEVTKLQQSYFQTIEANYGGPALAKEMMKIAKENVVSQLTETGLMANVADPVKEVIRRAITSGSGYATLQEQLNDVLAGENGGILERYTKQISTDAINQYSRQYSQLASADLGLEWFRYAGSNIKTSRPFCLACTDRKYFHISEIPALLRGDFPEFKQHDGKIYERTKLPQGMYPETDVANFPTLLGGYNCGHQYRPIRDIRIPDDIKQRVYESAEYKAWKGVDAKKDTGADRDEKAKVLTIRKEKDKEISDWAKSNIPGTIYPAEYANFSTKKVLISRRYIKEFSSHFTEPHLKDMAKEIYRIVEEARFIESKPLSKDSPNYEKKLKRGVTGYSYYQFRWGNQDWRLNAEIINGEYEKPYSANLILNKKE